MNNETKQKEILSTLLLKGKEDKKGLAILYLNGLSMSYIAEVIDLSKTRTTELVREGQEELIKDLLRSELRDYFTLRNILINTNLSRFKDKDLPKEELDKICKDVTKRNNIFKERITKHIKSIREKDFKEVKDIDENSFIIDSMKKADEYFVDTIYSNLLVGLPIYDENNT